jgi:hypothetical protein
MQLLLLVTKVVYMKNIAGMMFYDRCGIFFSIHLQKAFVHFVVFATSCYFRINTVKNFTHKKANHQKFIYMDESTIAIFDFDMFSLRKISCSNCLFRSSPISFSQRQSDVTVYVKQRVNMKSDE